MGKACGFCAYPWHHDRRPTVPNPTHHINIRLHLTWHVDSGWVVPYFPLSHLAHIVKKINKKLCHWTWLKSTLQSSMTQWRLAVFSALSVFITNTGFLIKSGGIWWAVPSVSQMTSVAGCVTESRLRAWKYRMVQRVALMNSLFIHYWWDQCSNSSLK